MNKFKGYLICTDCDGTLTDSQGNLSEENARAIRYFQSEGGLFTLATGRFPGHVETFKDQLKINAPIISLNGTLLYDTNKKETLKTWTMEKETCRRLLHYVQSNWKDVWEYWINFGEDSSEGYKPMEHIPEDGSLDLLLEHIPEKILKLVTIQPENVTKALKADLREKFGHMFRVDTSWPNGLEAQAPDSGKGIAVQYMKEQLNYSIHTTVGIGDYENDISLLEHTDISYAVENALDSVKQVADRVTVSNNDNAIEAVIKELEKW